MNLVDLIQIHLISTDGDFENWAEFLIKQMDSLDSRINKELLASTIMSMSGGHTPRFNTTSAFIAMGTAFFQRNARKITLYCDTYFAEYGLFDGYVESERRVTDRADTGTNDTSISTSSTSEQDGEIVENLSAFNDSDYTPRNQNINKNLSKSGALSSSNAKISNIGKEEEVVERKKTGALPQDVMERQLELINNLDLYGWIADLYECEMFVGVY